MLKKHKFNKNNNSLAFVALGFLSIVCTNLDNSIR